MDSDRSKTVADHIVENLTDASEAFKNAASEWELEAVKAYSAAILNLSQALQNLSQVDLPATPPASGTLDDEDREE